MKLQILSAAVASLALAACGGGDKDQAEKTSDTADASSLRAECDILATDPEAKESFVEMGTDEDGFCDCFVKVVEASPEDDQAQMRATLTEVTKGMKASGEGAEEVVSRIMQDAMMSPDSETSEATEAGVRLISDVIDDVSNGFEDSGSCPAS